MAEDTTEIVVVDKPSSPASMEPVGMQMPMDPLSLLLFGPLIMFMNTMTMFQRSMMGMGNAGMVNRAPGGGGFKIVELKRDNNGNIISIMEKW